MLELGQTLRMDPSVCPVCGRGITAATCATGQHAPKPEDLTVCFGCLMVLKYDQQLRPVKLPDEELWALPLDMLEDIQALQHKLEQVKRRENRT